MMRNTIFSGSKVEMVEIPCPLCGSRQSQVLIDEKITDLERGFDYLSESGGHFRINRCSGCSFIYSSPVFTEETLQNLYNAAEIGAYIAPTSDHGIAVNCERYVKRLVKHSGITSGRLLDVGCGCGQLLQAARDIGFEAYGVDPSREAAGQAKACGFEAVHGLYSADLYPENYFDLITIIHVIDHVMSPLDLLRSVQKHLRPGGAVLIATHNVQSLLAKLMGRHFIAYNVQHITYYTPDSLDQMLHHSGLKPIKRMRSLTTYSLDHLAENGLSNLRLRNAALNLFSGLGIGGLHVSFPFGNIEAIAVKE